MLDSNALSYIVLVVLETLTVISCISIFRLNVYLKNINHDDINTKKLFINNNNITININLISIIKKNIDTYTS